MDPAAVPNFPPEYVNASNAGTIVGVVGVFYFIALTFVALRVYCRLFLVRTLGIDDGLIIITAALAFVSWLCLVLQIPYGLGRHGLVVPVPDRIKFERITFWKTVLSDGFALGLLRISMAISLLRLNRDLKWYKYSLYALMAFVVAYSIQAITWLFVYCTPFSGWWEFQWMNPFDPRCKSFTTFVNLVYWNISCNIFTDVCLGTLPIPIIWNLKMKLRVKLYVIGILNLGYFAVLMGILKAVFMLTTGGNPDAIFHYYVHFWENLQLNIGIIAACASFLKPLVGRLLKINTSAGYYPSGQYAYGRSGRTPLGTNPGSRTNNKRRTGMGQDDFELHTKSEVTVGERGVSVSPGTTRVQGTRSRTSDLHPDGGMYASEGNAHSDANSEEIILQKPEPSHGIMMRRDFTVEYGQK